MVRIITEGFESVFIKKILIHMGFDSELFSVIESGGWTKLELLKPILNEYSDQGDKIVIIYDADGTYNGGGFDSRKEALREIIRIIGVNAEIFLFPNDTDDGDFESLLVKVAINTRQGVFECFNEYEKCVSSLNTEDEKFITPLRKSRIFAYLETIPESNNRKEKERKNSTHFYDDPKYWDFNADGLDRLKSFLTLRFED